MKFKISWAPFAFIACLPATADEESEARRLGKLARPILSENCFQCHGPADQKGKLRLDEPNDAIIPGKPLDSELWFRIQETDPEEIMPPPESHKSLSEADKKLLHDWIESGAEYVSHWSFEPIVDAGAKIDDVIAQRQEQASPSRLIRRLSLDLTGLPPKIEEVEKFERGEISYEALVDQYLASPHYGEHRARFWLDAARYSDTHGLQNDYFRAIWPYRQWVIDAFNENLPFDEFSTRQLAGDLLPEASADPVATGFLKSNPSTHEGGVIQEEYRVKYLMDRTDTVATTWLGLTAGCAACHDHKFDPISIHEYYSLTAFFADIEEPVMNGDRAYNGPIAHLPLGIDSEKKKRLIQWVSNPSLAPSASADVFGKTNEPLFSGKGTPAQTVALWARSTAGATILTQAAGRGDNRHGWELVLDSKQHVILRFLGKNPEGKSGKREYRSESPLKVEGLSHFTIALEAPTEVFSVFHNGKRVALVLGADELAEVQLAAQPQGEALLSKVSHLPVAPRYLLIQRYDRVLAEAEINQLFRIEPSLVQAMGEITAVACSIVAREGAPKASHVLLGGSYESKGDEVTAGTPAMLPPMPESFSRDRLGFAKWLFLPENPLTARVAVNRIWAQFFGVGLSKTQNDLGNQGSPPVYPELFDSLAADFQDDWDVKRLIRTLVMSEAYRQSSAVVAGKDRAHRMRLDGEVLRDQALAIGGLLERQVGGPPVSPYQPDGIWRAVSVDISDSKKYQQGTGTDLYRRSIYTVHKRTAGPPIMSNFDAPSREVCTVEREVTNTPLQALQLMNDVQFVEAARGLAHRALKSDDPLGRMFKLATCRDPEAAERKVLESLLKQFHDADTAALSQLGEFKEEVPGPYVMLATTLLNTDEVLCR
ncbi:MAG: PSD1 and planctomycete cytochrome C domain-containing protein [Akkermansiaceae bacterium]